MFFIFNYFCYSSDLLIAQPYLHHGKNTEIEGFARANLNIFFALTKT
jgi:hypothetical protein